MSTYFGPSKKLELFSTNNKLFSHNMVLTDIILYRTDLGRHTCVPVFKDKLWSIEHQEWKYSFMQTAIT